MELWIRSQDKKTLMKITRLYEFSNSIFSVDTRDNEIILGTYKKNKRALEVLNEIQNIFKPPLIIQKIEGFITTADNSMHIINPTFSDIKELSVVVYQMPEE